MRRRNGAKDGAAEPSLFDDLFDDLFGEELEDGGIFPESILDAKEEAVARFPGESKKKEPGFTPIPKDTHTGSSAKMDKREAYPEPISAYPGEIIQGKLDVGPGGSSGNGSFVNFRHGARVLHTLTTQYFQTCVRPKINIPGILREIHPEIENFVSYYRINASQPEGRMIVDTYKEMKVRERVIRALEGVNVVKVPFGVFLQNIQEDMGGKGLFAGEGETGDGGVGGWVRMSRVFDFLKQAQSGAFTYDESYIDTEDIDSNGYPTIRRKITSMSLFPKISILLSKSAPAELGASISLERSSELESGMIRSDWIDEIHFHFDPELFAPMIGFGSNMLMLHGDKMISFKKGYTWRLAHLVESVASEGSRALKEKGEFEKDFSYDFLETFFRVKYGVRSRIFSKIINPAVEEYNQSSSSKIDGYEIDISPIRKPGVRGYYGGRLRISLRFEPEFFVKPSFSIYEMMSVLIHFDPNLPYGGIPEVEGADEILSATFPEDRIYGMGDYLLSRDRLESMGIRPGSHYKEMKISEFQDIFHRELDAYQKLRQALIECHSWFREKGLALCDTSFSLVDRATRKPISFGVENDYSCSSALVYFYLSRKGKIPSNYIDKCPVVDRPNKEY